jgi:hypothetical protein
MLAKRLTLDNEKQVSLATPKVTAEQHRLLLLLWRMRMEGVGVLSISGFFLYIGSCSKMSTKDL